MICDASFLAQSATSWVSGHLDWLVAGAIVLLGLLVYGGGDVLRLSLGRIRAIASVCFSESIRRRVLWLTPLAIVGVVLVSQFQRPLDDQDAVRQVTKFCIFASGMLVTLAAVILACTNLPREIENRVIYTVVTKPTSRLEILLGKILGFSGITAAILVIMGVFSWGYLHVHEWRVLEHVDTQLKAGNLEPAAEGTLKFYAKTGLLDARSYATTANVQVYPEYPKEGQEVRYITGPNGQQALVPFLITPEQVPPDTKLAGMVVSLNLPWQQRRLTTEEMQGMVQLAEQLQLKLQVPPTPAGPGEVKDVDASTLLPAFIRLSFMTVQMEPWIDSMAINGGLPSPAFDSSGKAPVNIPLPGPVAQRVAAGGAIYLQLDPGSPGTRYTIDPRTTTLTFIPESGAPIKIASQPFRPDAPAGGVLTFGRLNQNGQQLAGDADGKGAEGVFTFRGVPASFAREAEAMFEYRTIVERGGDDVQKQQTPTWVDVRILNKKSGKMSDPAKFAVESRRIAHFMVPSEYLAGGDFDVLIRCLTPEQWISLRPGAMRLASDNVGFGLNLAKSLFILWLFSVLVVTVAIFCSTFVSWPIAFVLTLLILLGHWGVLQLGDLASPGVGRQIVNDLFAGAAPAVAETMNRTVEGLGSMLRLVAAVLPDISQFAAMQDIESGVAISGATLLRALSVLAMFGLPILTLSYVFFRNKEVAP